ncbi:hypothetical protein CBR_g48353 [Chara braunii]|uniref:Tyr recombinase domain-containing protein n=1 Tax=Chara braunii TaxID=69332 RepID=A0A388K4E2_CHABU|nr:hypothetical protein CBR_g48353 [Chara braunii]|eukprot:GBG64886.1 hypothetical protein CBR_g48353 [Chara braunii]
MSDGSWRQKRATPEIAGGYQAGLEWSSQLIEEFGPGKRWRNGMRKLLLGLNEWLERNGVGRSCMTCNDLDVLSFLGSQWLVAIESRCRTTHNEGEPRVSPSTVDVVINCLSGSFRLLGREKGDDPCQSGRVKIFKKSYQEYALSRGVVEESARSLGWEKLMIVIRYIRNKVKILKKMREAEAYRDAAMFLYLWESWQRCDVDVRKGYLFRAGRGSSALGGGAFNKRIEKWFGEAGVYEGESGHNFRVGGLRAGIEEGWSLGEMMRQGTWNSVGTFMRYGYGMRRGWKRGVAEKEIEEEGVIGVTRATDGSQDLSGEEDGGES